MRRKNGGIRPRRSVNRFSRTIRQLTDGNSRDTKAIAAERRTNIVFTNPQKSRREACQGQFQGVHKVPEVFMYLRVLVASLEQFVFWSKFIFFLWTVKTRLVASQ